MVLKKIRSFLLLSLAILWLPVSVQALGFGAPVLKSQLNDMLLVQVPLFLAKGESFNDVRITFAKKTEYRRVGLKPYTDLTGLRVTVKRVKKGEKSGQLYLELSSVYIIQSPMMSLLLKARLGHNTHYKHIQLFFDAKNMEPRKPASRQNQQNNIIPLKSEKEPTIEAEEQGWARTWRYGPIHSGESLSVIAYRLRRDSTWLKEDIALALYRLNPDAFIQHDMNKLKAGVWLEVPREPALKALLKQPPTIYEKRQPKPQKAVKKVTVKEKLPASKVIEKTDHPAHYVGRVSLGDKAGNPVVKENHSTPSKHALLLEKRLDQLYKQSMADHAQMQSMDQNLRAIRHDLSKMGEEIATLKIQQPLVRKQPLQQEIGIHYWMWFFLLLCFINVIVIGIYLYRRYRGTINKALEAKGLFSNKKIVDVQPKRKKDRTTNLLENKIYDIENHLDNQNYQAAESIFEQLSQTDSDHFVICALQARLYHETGREGERDAFIGQKRDFLSETKWNLLCDRLPISLWHALNESGVIEGSGDLFHSAKEGHKPHKVSEPINDDMLEMDLSSDEEKSLEQLKMEITQIMEIPDFVRQSEEEKDADTTNLPEFTPFPNTQLQNTPLQNVDIKNSDTQGTEMLDAAMQESYIAQTHSNEVADPLSLHDLEFDLQDDGAESSDDELIEANETLAPAERDALKFLQMTQVSKVVKQDTGKLNADKALLPQDIKHRPPVEKVSSNHLPHIKESDKTFDPMALDDIEFKVMDKPLDSSAEGKQETSNRTPKSNAIDSVKLEVMGDEALLSSEMLDIEFEAIDKASESNAMGSMEFEVMGEALQSSEMLDVEFEAIDKTSESSAMGNMEFKAIDKASEYNAMGSMEFEVMGEALQSSEIMAVEFEKIEQTSAPTEVGGIDIESLNLTFSDFDMLDDITFESMAEGDDKPISSGISADKSYPLDSEKK
ncbi:MAG: hypothetical protein Q9M20_02660 [Mariprofundaceae bacterium]|nr:hypothetical protein [Mariprofundaceae bacterium]